jgi:hypothetical protein
MTTCSADALAVHEPLAGTAPYATAWIVVEQPGPWGRDALTDSRLPEPIAAHLGAAKGSGVGVLLARHPDRSERSGITGRHVWLARTYAGATILRHAVVDSLDVILEWDLAAIGEGRLPAFATSQSEPLLLICTNSGRDRCCATLGRALASMVMERVEPSARMDVWECSHIGGHRFAPVSLSLPTGAVHGRLDIDAVMGIRRRAREGQVVVDHLRGRSSLPAALQVAAIEAQSRHGIARVDDLDVLVVRGDTAIPARPALAATLGEERSIVTEVRHVDGRRWRGTVVSRALSRDRLESCGKEPTPGIAWSCVELAPVDPWR